MTGTQHPLNEAMRSSIKCITEAIPFSPSLTMLFLIFVYYFVQGATIDASPKFRMIPPINSCSFELVHCRSMLNIIWSCPITIFSCTWVAVHPNIPCPGKRDPKAKICFQGQIRNPLLSFAEHPLFICASLVPEYMLAWAIRQYMSARKIAHDNEGESDTLG